MNKLLITVLILASLTACSTNPAVMQEYKGFAEACYREKSNLPEQIGATPSACSCAWQGSQATCQVQWRSGQKFYYVAGYGRGNTERDAYEVALADAASGIYLEPTQITQDCFPVSAGTACTVGLQWSRREVPKNFAYMLAHRPNPDKGNVFVGPVGTVYNVDY